MLAPFAATGKIEYTCVKCGEKKTEDLAKLVCSEHKWNDGEVLTAPTYKEPGEMKYTCTVCGEIKTEPIAKLVCSEHTYGEANFTAPLFDEEGNVVNGKYESECTRCGEIKTEEVVPYATLEEAFNLDKGTFGYDSGRTDKLELDGNGTTYVYKWVDAWVSCDLTIKGVIFMNGAVFNQKKDDIKITLTECTFYACDQSKLVYTSNNSLTNSGGGMCLNLEKSSHNGVEFTVSNCKFIGENDPTLSTFGNRYNADGTVKDQKKRGHAIALDAICGGGTGTLKSLTIENCEMSGVRGNAIQLYGTTGDILIKDTKINSWAVCSEHIGYAIRGDFNANGARTLNLVNVYFGLDEISGNKEFGQVKVGSFAGNTDTTRTAGTYSSEHMHVWTITDVKEPTYTEDGYTKKVCKLCGEEVKEDIAKKTLPVALPEKTVSATTNEELVASVKAELSGSDSVEFTLGEGSFALKDQNITTAGKTVILNGAGKDKTTYMTVYNAQKGGEYGAEYTFDGAKAVVFKNMTVDFGESNYSGIIRPETIVFENCAIKGMITYCGSEKAMFVNCEFTVENNYNMWIYANKAMSYEFYGCTFSSKIGKFLHPYNEGGAASLETVTILINGCSFSGEKADKAALNVKAVNNIAWNITIENSTLGENVSEWYNMAAGVNASSTVTIDGKVVWENGAKTENN